jgi:molybdenum cofactor guanylyltransferase
MVGMECLCERSGQNGLMKVAGMLLTGGASRRLGVDKSGLDVGDGPLAERTARLLQSVADPCIEVGRGHSTLPLVADLEPGQGPLAAVMSGWAELKKRSWVGPTLVLATDLPFLSHGLLRWLASHPSRRSLVPCDGRHPQTLCARYRAADLDTACDLYRVGARAMTDLLAAIDPRIAPPEEWQAAAGHAFALLDVDTPSDLARARQTTAVLSGEAGRAGPR